ncbi:MAG: hypothetical protein GX219_03405, partial [Tissierellia bacterium]|nr:hypothetical protein [Tissierellia bacterium]
GRGLHSFLRAKYKYPSVVGSFSNFLNDGDLDGFFDRDFVMEENI